jgi:hypothetical protein
MTQTQPNDLITRRSCLQLSGMDTVAIQRDVEYCTTDSGPLTMDLYYPPDVSASRPLPAVIIVAGYSDAMEPRLLDCIYKDLGWTVSMAQLIAVSGMVAVTYTNREPARDLQALFAYLQDHGPSLRIPGPRVGVVAASGNVPTALATLMHDASRTPACAVFSCGYMLDSDGSMDVADAAAQWRFANPCAGKSISDLRHDVPLFIARAGLDQFPGVNASIDRFVRSAIDANLPVTFVNHSDGPHAFDLFHDSLTSREIVRQLLAFLQRHLLASEISDAEVDL